MIFNFQTFENSWKCSGTFLQQVFIILQTTATEMNSHQENIFTVDLCRGTSRQLTVSKRYSLQLSGVLIVESNYQIQWTWHCYSLNIFPTWPAWWNYFLFLCIDLNLELLHKLAEKQNNVTRWIQASEPTTMHNGECAQLKILSYFQAEVKWPVQ